MAIDLKDEAESLVAIADGLDASDQQGAATDEPEGARFITVSDTLARKIVARLRAAAVRLEDISRGYRRLG